VSRPAAPLPDAAAEYLTITELGVELGYTPRPVRKKMRDGTWRKGEHWFKPQGCRPRFYWPAIVAWLREADEPCSPHGAAFDAEIMPARRGRPGSAV
jgi:hypothetical protein